MLDKVLDDLADNGPISALIGDHPAATSPLFCLRVLAGLRLLVLTGKAPQLAEHLVDFVDRGGDPDFDQRTWELFREAVLNHPAEIGAALDRPIQQHHPRRGAMLLTGLAMLSAPRIRLYELGACAGLNLLVDRYRWFGRGWQWGDLESPVRLTTTGRHPGPVEVVERGGCDLAPRDPNDPADVLILRSFIPHEHDIEAMELGDALALAARTGPCVEKASAADWLTDRLRDAPDDRSVYTVIWHSLTWGYLRPQEQEAVEDILDEASRRMRLARISYEPPMNWARTPRLDVSVYS